MPPALELRHITKRFGQVLANDDVSLAVATGEIRALVGENGAGKTTLMNILYGLQQPDEGEILIGGTPRRFDSPLDAIRSGLGMVHQHFMLFPTLTVAENVVFGAEPTRGGLLDRRGADEAVESLAQSFGVQLDPQARVASLPVGVRQRIEILKMLYRGAEILILDEPTAVLTPQERDSLFEVLRSLAESGKTVIFITHKLPEVLTLADRATALRDGVVTGTVETATSSAPEISRLMVGRDVALDLERVPAPEDPEVVLQIQGLTISGRGARDAVRDLDLQVRAGEILGVAGAAGNGQTELIDAIAGLRLADAGRISLSGTDISRLDVARRRQTGQSHIPEDRDGDGLALDASLDDNLLMGFESEPEYASRGVLLQAPVRRHAESLLTDLSVKTRSVDARAADLSGGNRQKVVLAREMAHESRLLIAEQPTRGVDIGATEQIYRLLVQYRDRGNAVLLVSTDLTEILALSDRIVVMFEGAIVGERLGSETSEQELGLLMAGGKQQ